MERKYQVFISSTYSDLVEERRKVLDVLLMADCIPAGMEAFVATDIEQFEVIKKVIDLCDYYVLIIGKRYGSIHPETGISYTEMEYNYAISKDVPVLVFALDDSVDLPEDKCESDSEKIEKLKAFRSKAMTNRLASIWHSADELTGRLAVSIMKAKSEIVRPGWQRGEDYDEASLRREIMTLQEENKDLKEELEKSKKELDAFTMHTDLAFENCPITIPYSHSYNDGRQTRTNYSEIDTDLKHIFLAIATEMMDVSITEKVAEDAIKKHFLSQPYSCSISDNQFIKKVLNQFRALNLMKSTWSNNNHVLYWGLTKKGAKERDDSLLIRCKE